MDFLASIKYPRDVFVHDYPEHYKVFWIGHYELSIGCKITSPDYRKRNVVYIYISIEDAVRLKILYPDNKNIKLVFKKHPLHDAHLEYYKKTFLDKIKNI